MLCPISGPWVGLGYPVGVCTIFFNFIFANGNDALKKNKGGVKQNKLTEICYLPLKHKRGMNAIGISPKKITVDSPIPMSVYN